MSCSENIAKQLGFIRRVFTTKCEIFADLGAALNQIRFQQNLRS